MPVFLVDKPLGLTSHDVVAEARRRLRTRRVGHGGTLDPLASGLLVLLVDDATRLSPYVSGGEKAYLAWVAFGAGTPTLDAEGPIERRADPTDLDAAAVAGALHPFLALTEQRPPAFSAVKRGGVRSYERARAGEAEELPPRPAGYVELELLAFAPTRDALPHAFAPDDARRWRPSAGGRAFPLPPTLLELPTALVRARVRSGTYLRSLARDLGDAVGLPAHLAGLVRTRSGALGLEEAVALDDLADATPVAAVEALSLPRVVLDAEAAARVRQGQRPSLPGDGELALVTAAGGLVAIARVEQGRTVGLRVWPETEGGA